MNSTPQSPSPALIAPIKSGMYRHSKSGRLYEVLGTGHHSETLEVMVVYRAQYHSPEFGDSALWMRPAHMFEELVNVDGKKVPRFVFVNDAQTKTKFDK